MNVLFIIVFSLVSLIVFVGICILTICDFWAAWEDFKKKKAENCMTLTKYEKD